MMFEGMDIVSIETEVPEEVLGEVLNLAFTEDDADSVFAIPESIREIEKFTRHGFSLVHTQSDDMIMMLSKVRWETLGGTASNKITTQ